MVDLPRLPDLEGSELDMDKAIELARRQAGQAGELHDRLSGLVGRAESVDGRIRLAFSPTEGLPELHIDPRAMRLGSDELADQIKEVVHRAIGDLDEQRKRETQEITGEEPQLLNAERIQTALTAMREVMQSASDDVETLMRQVRNKIEPH